MELILIYGRLAYNLALSWLGHKPRVGQGFSQSDQVLTLVSSMTVIKTTPFGLGKRLLMKLIMEKLSVFDETWSTHDSYQNPPTLIFGLEIFGILVQILINSTFRVLRTSKGCITCNREMVLHWQPDFQTWVWKVFWEGCHMWESIFQSQPSSQVWNPSSAPQT